MRENPAGGLTALGTEHECVAEVNEETSEGLAEEPLTGEVAINLSVDGARKYVNGEPCAEWAVVNDEETLIAGEQIPGSNSAQEAELIAFTKDLEWGTGKRINI